MTHQDVETLKQEIEILKAQLTQVTCEKVALDNSYGDQMRLTYQIRTQLAYAQAEVAALQDRLKKCEHEKNEMDATLKTLEAAPQSDAA